MQKAPSTIIFEKILDEGKSYIDDAITDKAVESYYLDFKTTEQEDYSGKRKLFVSDKKNYAKAISAFGNSEGGLVIWGIKTGRADADYACGKKPIKNVSNFRSLLEGFTSIVTSPAHPKIINEIIYQDESEDEGYVITHIPKSNKRPFQVINEKDYRYYIRAGSNSQPAPDNFLRALFGQEPQPNAFMTWGVPPVKFEDNIIKLQVGIIIHNGGENVAKNINGYIALNGLGLALELNRNTINDFSYNENNISGIKIGFVAKQHFILGIEQEVSPLTMHINISKPITENGIRIIALVSGDNQQSHRLHIEVSKDELEKIYDNYISDNTFSVADAIFYKDKKNEER